MSSKEGRCLTNIDLKVFSFVVLNTFMSGVNEGKHHVRFAISEQNIIGINMFRGLSCDLAKDHFVVILHRKDFFGDDLDEILLLGLLLLSLFVRLKRCG